MRVFVSGGTGFIGANLVRLLLKQGYDIRVLVREHSSLDALENLEVEIVRGDLNDPELYRKLQGCQALFHVAAHYSLWQRDKQSLYECNVLGTRNILQASQQAKVDRVVYTSSVAAIGVNPTGAPVDETFQSPVGDLVGHYKKSKYWAEQEAVKAHQAGLDIVIVNPSTPIGPWDIKPTPTGDILLRFLRQKMPAYVNTGLNIIDVKDVAWGHLLALEKGEKGERYILGNQNLTLKELLQILSDITGLPVPQHTLPLWLPLTIAWIEEWLLEPLGKSPTIPIDGVRMSRHPMYYQATKASQKLGLPQSSIKNAIQEAVDWFRDRDYV